MIRSLIKIGLVLLVGIVGYNYFFGTEAEKESSRKIVNKAKDLGKSVGGLFKSERAKFDEGKYDDALAKVGNVFDGLKRKAKDGGELLDRIKDLEKKKDELKDKVALADKEGDGEASKAKVASLKAEFKQLLDETETLVDEVEKEEK